MGKLLCASGELFYVQEPLNPSSPPTWLGHPVDHWYEYVLPGSREFHALERIVRREYPLGVSLGHARTPRAVGRAFRDSWMGSRARLRGQPALIKDPFLVFSAEYLRKSLGLRVVYTVRNPAAFVSSLSRLNWTFDFRNLANQPVLMDRLEAWGSDILRASRGELSFVEQSALLWKVIHGYLAAEVSAEDLNDVVVHEEFVLDVPGNVARLYKRLGLTLTDDARDRVRLLSSNQATGDARAGQVTELKRDSRLAGQVWRSRMSDAEAARVIDLCRPEFDLFYPSGL